MTAKSAIRVQTAFGLAFDVEKTLDRPSGFKPARVDFTVGPDLYGELRLSGFAAALECGFTQRLIIVGGLEARYPDESVGRAVAIRRMLIEDFGAEVHRVDTLESQANTAGNVAAIKKALEDMKLSAEECAVLSSHYHLPRVLLKLHGVGCRLCGYPAEALWLANGEDDADRLDRAQRLLQAIGGSLAARVVAELNGIADTIRGAYQPR